MRMICKAFAICLLFSMPGVCLAQRDDPFGAGADPFERSKPKPVKPAKPAAPQRVAQPKILARPMKVNGKVVPRPTSSDATLRIRAALGAQTSQTFIDLPLEECLQQLSESHNIPMIVDRRALEEIGLTSDAPVTLGLKNVSLRSFLRLMLRNLDLTYMVQNEVLLITTIQAAEQNLVLEMYKFPQELTEKSDQVVTALTMGVQPQVWTTSGGPCTVTAIENVLVVAATESIHEEVIGFMQKLEEAFEQHQAAK